MAELEKPLWTSKRLPVKYFADIVKVVQSIGWYRFTIKFDKIMGPLINAGKAIHF